MKQKLVSFAAAVCIAVSSLVPAAASSRVRADDTTTKTSGTGSIKIQISTPFSDVADMVDKFFSIYPDMASKYTVTTSTTYNDDSMYETKLNAALVSGVNAPDIYVAEADYIAPYTKGELSSYAAAYSSFIPYLSNKISSAEIMPYIVDVGTNKAGNIVGLSYQSTPVVMIYNSAIAKSVFGTDEPSKISSIFGGGSGTWDKFLSASATLKQKGYAVASSLDDIWHVCDNAGNVPWVVDGKLKVNPQRYAYIDLAYNLAKNNYTNGKLPFWGDWFEDMEGTGKDSVTGKSRKVFSFFGPSWFVGFIMQNHSSSSWRICEAPLSSWWGGSWFMANKSSVANADKKAFIAKFIEWVTLDTSTTGLQYLWTTGAFYDSPALERETVASCAVMRKINGTFSLLGNQNTYPTFIQVGKKCTGKSCCAYDSAFGGYLCGEVNEFIRSSNTVSDVFSYMTLIGQEYGLDVSSTKTPPLPVKNLRAISAGNKKVRLSWTPDPNAEGYLIYAKKNNKYAYVGMTSKGSASSYLDTNALDNDYNFYWVFAFYRDNDGTSSTTKMITTGCGKYVFAKGICSAVTNLKANGSTGKVTLTWNASEGADGYLIYGIRPGGKYGYIGMASGTTFPDTKASKTDWTFYWVFPYNKVGDKMIVGGTAPYVYSKAR